MSLRSLILVATRDSLSEFGLSSRCSKNFQFVLIDDAKLSPLENSTKHIALLKKNFLPLHAIKERTNIKNHINYGKGEYFNYD